MRQIVSLKGLWERKDLLLKGAVVLLIVIMALFAFFNQGREDEEFIMSGEDSEATQDKDQSDNDTDPLIQIVVDVAGAVKNPSVVQVPDGSRMTDAIEEAGGLTEDADISQLNRAAILTDGEKVYVPFITENSAGSVADPSTSGKISINSATSAELEGLTGIGPVTAASIIAYRNENGRFQKLTDLMEVSGIGEKTYEKLKSEIVL